MVKSQINQIASLIKVSILNATNRRSDSSGGGTRVGTGVDVAEAEDVPIGTTNRTAMNFANGSDTGERTGAGVAVARQGQFKQRGKSSSATIICAPAPSGAFCF